MDWGGFFYYTILPVLVSAVFSGLMGYYLGKLAWVRNAKRETAKERLKSLWEPLQTYVEDFVEDIEYYDGDDHEFYPFNEEYRDLGDEFKNYWRDLQRLSLYGDICTKEKSLHADIRKFFRNLGTWYRNKRYVKIDLYDVLEDPINEMLEEVRKFEPHEKALRRKRNVAMYELANYFFTSVVLDLAPEKGMEHDVGNLLRSYLAPLSPSSIDDQILVNLRKYVYDATRGLETVRKYRESKDLILRSGRELVERLTMFAQRDRKIAYP